MKSQAFRLAAANLVVGSRLMVTPSEGALFSLFIVIGDLNSSHGNYSNRLAPPTGFGR